MDTVLKVAVGAAVAWALYRIGKGLLGGEQAGEVTGSQPVPELPTFDAVRARITSPPNMGLVNLPFFGDRRVAMQVEYHNRGNARAALLARIELEYQGFGRSSWTPPVVELAPQQRFLVDYLVPYTAPALALGGGITTARLLARLPGGAGTPSAEWTLDSATFITT
jgi:hypothetical protein